MACAQDYGEVDCTLAVILDLTGVGLDATTAKEISQAALQLGAVRVSIVHDPAVRLSVRSEVFKELAPVLHKLELHPVAATSASIVGRKPSIKGNCVSLKYSELQQANQSLQTLCILHWCDGPWTRCRAAIAMHHMVCCIAQLGSLRKLHLTLEDSLTSALHRWQSLVSCNTLHCNARVVMYHVPMSL